MLNATVADIMNDEINFYMQGVNHYRPAKRTRPQRVAYRTPDPLDPAWDDEALDQRIQMELFEAEARNRAILRANAAE